MARIRIWKIPAAGTTAGIAKFGDRKSQIISKIDLKVALGRRAAAALVSSGW